ncbi:hypothetical protein [Apibacter muscae]|uniref:hypothetical protein n=1 Tax=Apibacter muscae TaxID=2509004 RepID=UPI001C8798E0|nr:hypothetical protein [Apibacter muscae]
MRSAVHKAIEFRDKLKSQKKGDGAFEKYLGGRGINSQFGDTMGEYSGREFFKDKCGGKILDLDYKNTTITKEGIETVKEHTSRFGEDHANQKMIERLEAIERGELEITEYDKRYYTHEIRESQRYDNMGVEKGEKGSFEQWNDAHTATLEDYKINEIEQPLYHPEALNE